MAKPEYKFTTLTVSSPVKHVLRVELDRPAKGNSMTKAFWREFRECFQHVRQDSDVRAVVITANGKIFTGGLDVAEHAVTLERPTDHQEDSARRALKLHKFISSYQDSFSAIEACHQPVIVAINGACIGGGMDLITACDIRLCSEDAWFAIKEVDVGLAADTGTLQRLPRIIGNHSLVRDLVYTGRKLTSREAKECGLVSGVFKDRDTLISEAIALATTIASKSPIAVAASKITLNYSRDHTVQDGLSFVASVNSSMLQTTDLMESMVASMEKRRPVFSKL